MYDAIDVAGDVSDFADDIARKGVKTVIRYYNHRNSRKLPTKRLEKEEAQVLADAGLSLMVVFQQRGGSQGHIEDLDAQSGRLDGARAVELARGLGQPAGSAIYFAVDHDYFRSGDLRRIAPYFEAVKAELGADYRVGVYGSGTIGRTMAERNLVDLIWLAGATGWSGTRAMLQTNDWAIFQKYFNKAWPSGGFHFDGNIANPTHADFGQFALDGFPATRPIQAVSLMEVNARFGLKLRKGPSTEYADSTTVPAGTLVSAVGRSGEWVMVDLEGDGRADGFMHGAFLHPITAGGAPGDA